MGAGAGALPGEREARLAYGALVLGLPPRELLALDATAFGSVATINAGLAAPRRRLRRSPALRQSYRALAERRWRADMIDLRKTQSHPVVIARRSRTRPEAAASPAVAEMAGAINPMLTHQQIFGNQAVQRQLRTGTLPPGVILGQQRTLGNQAVQRLLRARTRPAMTAPDDQFEQRAAPPPAPAPAAQRVPQDDNGGANAYTLDPRLSHQSLLNPDFSRDGEGQGDASDHDADSEAEGYDTDYYGPGLPADNGLASAAPAASPAVQSAAPAGFTSAYVTSNGARLAPANAAASPAAPAAGMPTAFTVPTSALPAPGMGSAYVTPNGARLGPANTAAPAAAPAADTASPGGYRPIFPLEGQVGSIGEKELEDDEVGTDQHDPALPADAVATPAAPAAGPAPTKKALNLLKLRGEYEQELQSQRPDLLKAVRDTARQIEAYSRLRREIVALSPDDAAGLADFIATKGLAVTMTGKPYAEVVAGLDTNYNLWLQLSQRQEFPISPEGVVDEDALKQRMVSYDRGDDAQASTKVTFSGGRLIRGANHPTQANRPADTEGSVTMFSGPGWEIFVVSPAGDIHLASHKVGKYHHSSLLAGGAVAMGGEMKVADGTIEKMSNKSGHYHPSPKHFRQFLHRLRKQGVPLTFQIVEDAKFGIAKGTTAPGLEAGSGRETYHAEKLATVLESLKAQHGDQAVEDALIRRGWSERPGGGITQADGTPVPDKRVLHDLKEEFGRARSKLTQAGTRVGWV